MRQLVVGMGEIGTAYYNILRRQYGSDILSYDKRDGDWPGDKRVEVLHICTPFFEDFVEAVSDYAIDCEAQLINIMTTVPPGTTQKIGPNACHSTTRIMHSPNRQETAEEFILTIPKHIGGSMAKDLSAIFESCGIECICEARPEVTELAHILNNVEYALLCAFADEKQRICRTYGVDYLRAVMAYTQTYNMGYSRMGHESKCRPILTPPGGKIGGHCTTQNATMMVPILEAAGLSVPLMRHVAEFNR